MRWLLFLSLCLFGRSVVWAAPPDQYSLNEKAGSFLWHKEYDSAIVYYTILQRDFPNFLPISTLYDIALCYLGKKDTAEAERCLLACLQMDKKKDLPIGSTQISACRTLSTLLCGQHAYRAALSYLDSTKAEKYQPALKECRGGFGYLADMDFGYRRSMCYAGLGQTDSAIRELSPQAFYAYPAPLLRRMLDSNAFIRISRSLLSLLDGKYGKEKIRSEMKRGLDSAWYQVTEVPQTNPKLAGLVKAEYSIGCGFYFFGIPIVLYKGGVIFTKGRDTTIPSYLTRDYFVEEARKSYTYQEIMKD
jgi:tetratricopeptide (TPR) repeat protein